MRAGRFRPSQRTEAWLILDKRLGLLRTARSAWNQMLHDTCDRYARCCAAVAVGLWLLGLAIQLLT